MYNFMWEVYQHPKWRGRVPEGYFMMISWVFGYGSCL